MLKPFLAACEIKSPKLVSIALASIQKLLANDLVTAEGLLAVTRALEQVPSLHCAPCRGRLPLHDAQAVMQRTAFCWLLAGRSSHACCAWSLLHAMYILG